jgi:DNA-binding GntR family transcriptional regulator
MNTTPTSLTMLAYERIRDAIVFGPLDLGEPLSENGLAKALGMSKAPIRAAMNELRLKGLVQVVPHSGTYVFSPTRQDIEELCDFRALLEVQALVSAMSHARPALLAGLDAVVTAMRRGETGTRDESRRLDSEFHQLFITHCGNRYLADAYATIGHRVEALRHRFMDTTVFRHKAFAEHEDIPGLLRAGKVTRATAVLEAHIARTRLLQSTVTWSAGRSRRRDYKFREQAGPFLAIPAPTR